jgi:type IV pilus assembly protein PilA
MSKLRFKSKTRLNVSKGFTLIEVVVAVSIVILLASLTIPKVSAYIDKAKNVKVINTAKQIYTAAMWSYAENNNEFNKAKVVAAVTKLSDVTGILESNVIDGNDSESDDYAAGTVTIKFSSGGKSCSLIITKSDSSYVVKEGTNSIFESSTWNT